MSYEHDFALLKWKSLEPDEYLCDLYRTKTMLNIYNIPIHSLSDVIEWMISQADEVLFTIIKRPHGRPKKKSCEKNIERVIQD